MKYIIMFSTFSPVRNDSIVGFFDGIEYDTREEAEKVVKRERKDNLDLYIREKE